MKKILFLIVMVWAMQNVYAQQIDSCYVYAQIEYIPSIRPGVKIQAGSSKIFEKIVDKEGNEIKFVTLINALNYFSMQGWELVQMYYPLSPLNNSDLNQRMIIKKKMPKDKARTYIEMQSISEWYSKNIDS